MLEEQGHEVVTLDLPGHGEDSTEIADVSLQGYTEKVIEALEGSDEPVVLVGHSMGGLPVSQAASQHPEKVAKLVYLTAFLLQEGQTLLDVAGPDKGLIIPNLEFSDDQSSAKVSDGKLVEAFYADCSEEDIETAREKLVWQAAAPFATPIALSSGYSDVPKFYIECVDDRAITIEAQRAMQSAEGDVEVITMESSHSPFFSKPEELAQNLDKIAS